MSGSVKKKRLSLGAGRAVTGLLFVSPFIIGFIAFYARSLFMTIQFSFSDLSLLDNGGYVLDFTGLKHYIYAFAEHPSFKQTLTTSLIDIVVDVPLIIFFSLFIAVLLNQKFKGRTLARAIFFFPVILNAPAIADSLEMARSLVLGGTSPASAAVMESVGSGNVNVGYYVEMLGDLGLPRAILDYLIEAVSRINNIITSSGVQIVIFIAALQSIAPSLYEVAKIEGATAYETFWKITFPMVSPLIVTNIVYTMVDSFVTSDVVDLAYSTIFGAGKQYGLGSALSLISMVVVCGLLLVVSAIISKKTFYQN
ncbi:lactose ABC transporter permease [Clostridia bacterium]|nr:lactose ABC transporter permease [Clostridia bacterium]